jgi:hypothetical protein
VIDQKTHRVLCTAFTHGRKHDYRLFKESNLKVHSQTQVWVDTGYTGILKLHAYTQIPKKKRKKEPLSFTEKKENKKISSQRVFIEHVIGKLKRFKILSYPYRNRRKRFALRFNLISAFYNKDFIR